MEDSRLPRSAAAVDDPRAACPPQVRFDPRGGLRALVCVVLALGSAGAAAIVSERHLTGVHPFACDGQWEQRAAAGPPPEFRLVVHAKEDSVELETDNGPGTTHRYQIVEGGLLFKLTLPPVSGEADCRLDLPAGSLSCSREDAPQAGKFIGLCLPLE